MAKYLRKKGTNRLLVWTRQLANRDDMIEISEETVKTRIAEMRRRVEAAKQELADRLAGKTIQDQTAELDKELVDLEKEYIETQKQIQDLDEKEMGIEGEEEEPVLSEEEAEEKRIQELIDADPEIIRIKGMTEDQLIEYLASEYGIKASKRDKKKDTLAKALEERTKIIREGA